MLRTCLMKGGTGALTTITTARILEEQIYWRILTLRNGIENAYSGGTVEIER